MKITIDVSMLKAAVEFSAVRDVRYYLMGVLIDSTGFMVATDGHCMFVGKLAADSVEDGARDVILPLDVCKEIVATKALKIDIDVLPPAESGLACECSVVGWRVAAFKSIDARFPDWRRVYPKKVSGFAASINPELAIKCVKARKALGVSAANAGQFATFANGQDAHVAVLSESAHAILMPLRNVEMNPDRFEPLIG